MKYRNLLIYTLIILSYPIMSAQDIMWEKSFGGRHADYLADVQPTMDYGFILAGSSLSKKTGTKSQEGTGDLDYLIWKMDESGSTDWQKSYGGSGSDLLKVVLNTPDGGFILGGISNSAMGFDKKEEGRGGSDFWIIRTDAKGNELWQKVFGGKGEDDLTALIRTKDGGFLIGGSSSSTAEANEKLLGRKKESSRGSLDYWIIKIDAEGNEQWQRTYGGKYADVLQSMTATADGGYIVGGYSNSPASKDKATANLGSGNDFWILKLDEQGAMEWQQSLGGAGEDQLKVVLQTKDGNYIAAGHSNSTTRTSKNGADLWMVKLDTAGLPLWEKAFDIAKNDILTSLIEEQDGTFLLGAYSPSGYKQAADEEGVNDFVALKISATGEELWRKVIGSNGEDVLKKLIQTRDGGYLLVGTANPEFNGYSPKNSKQHLTKALKSVQSGEQLAGAKKLQDEMDATISDYSTQANDFVKEHTTAVTDQINNTINKNNDSGFKVGINGPVGNLLNPTNSESDASGGQSVEKQGPKPGSKMSKDKKINYGGKDYWVVKIKDKEKALKEKVAIEAYPNPTSTSTNVIIGFDFDRGTAAVYDLGGKELQNFKIDDRTVPVNLSEYPIGIYIINIKTNKGEGSVKIIKE